MSCLQLSCLCIFCRYFSWRKITAKVNIQSDESDFCLVLIWNTTAPSSCSKSVQSMPLVQQLTTCACLSTSNCLTNQNWQNWYLCCNSCKCASQVISAICLSTSSCKSYHLRIVQIMRRQGDCGPYLSPLCMGVLQSKTHCQLAIKTIPKPLLVGSSKKIVRFGL